MITIWPSLLHGEVKTAGHGMHGSVKETMCQEYFNFAKQNKQNKTKTKNKQTNKQSQID